MGGGGSFSRPKWRHLHCATGSRHTWLPNTWEHHSGARLCPKQVTLVATPRVHEDVGRLPLPYLAGRRDSWYHYLGNRSVAARGSRAAAYDSGIRLADSLPEKRRANAHDRRQTRTSTQLSGRAKI